MNNEVTAAEFAKNNTTDADWVNAMGGLKIRTYASGQRVTYSGFKATVVSHYRNGMYNIKLASGFACVGWNEILPA